MPLLSHLYRTDRRLQDCAVSDPAHILQGARGEHVAKIHYALAVLDRAQIERSELTRQFYGSSTARAVLAFKSKRAIINKAYQSKPDDIVGKMTVATLDRELMAVERRCPASGDCGAAGVPVLERSGLSRSGFAVGAAPQKKFNKAARIYVCATKRSASSGYPLATLIENARRLLAPFGITLTFASQGIGDVLDTEQSIVIDEDVAYVRKLSEDKKPGLADHLRVILCEFRGDFGRTKRDISVGGQTFAPFVLLNTLEIDQTSGVTLLHEMIHASHLGAQPHDRQNPNSVFAEAKAGVVRNVMPENHATSIAGAFYAR